MRIDSLWINKFKNFDDFEIDFKQEYLINILLGKNGTGKSNIIEVITSIFLHLELSNTKKSFVESFDYDFLIKYNIANDDTLRHFSISKLEDALTIKMKVISPLITEEVEIGYPALKRLDENMYLPKYVIGYYSGSNERLKPKFKLSEQKYYKEVRSNRDQESEFRRFFYAETYHCQLLLISLLTFAKTNKKIADFLTEYLDYSEFVDFTVSLKSPDWNRGVSLKDGVNKFWGANGTPFRFCNYLLVESKSEPVIEYNIDLDIKNKVKERISFYIKGPDFLRNAVEYFHSGIDLFRHIESTYISGLIDKIVIRIKKKSSDDIIEFEELSEGEQQMITILGLLLFTSNDNALFLLDEPDTHLNPNWQRDYLSLFIENAASENNHIIISTHSPLMVQSAEEAGIILFKLENGKPNSNSDTHFIHNWRIDQVLTSEYFGLKSARPPQLDVYMELRESILSKRKLEVQDIESLKSHQDTFGRLPTGETIDELKALILINRITDKLPKDNDKN